MEGFDLKKVLFVHIGKWSTVMDDLQNVIVSQYNYTDKGRLNDL